MIVGCGCHCASRTRAFKSAKAAQTDWTDLRVAVHLRVVVWHRDLLGGLAQRLAQLIRRRRIAWSTDSPSTHQRLHGRNSGVGTCLSRGLFCVLLLFPALHLRHSSSTRQDSRPPRRQARLGRLGRSLNARCARLLHRSRTEKVGVLEPAGVDWKRSWRQGIGRSRRRFERVEGVRVGWSRCARCRGHVALRSCVYHDAIRYVYMAGYTSRSVCVNPPNRAGRYAPMLLPRSKDHFTAMQVVAVVVVWLRVENAVVGR